MKKLACVVAAAISLSVAALAQDEPPKPAVTREFYRLDFVLKETENGKVISSRNFQMMKPSNDHSISSIRSGDRLAVPVDGKSNYTYLDVGINLDVRNLLRVNDGLELEVIAEVSSAEAAPTVRQVRSDTTVLIPIRKAAVVFLADGPTTKRQMQLEVTATPVH